MIAQNKSYLKKLNEASELTGHIALPSGVECT